MHSYAHNPLFPDIPLPTVLSNLNSGCNTCPCTLEVLCTTTDSNVLAWMSSNYIGPELELQLTINSSIGNSLKAPFNPKTSAVLLYVFSENGRIWMTSHLSIIVQNNQMSYITCLNKDLGTNTTYQFQLSGILL